MGCFCLKQGWTYERCSPIVKDYPNSRFCWPDRLSSGVDSVVNSHIQPCGHHSDWTKESLKNNKQTTNRRWKEETDEHGFTTANAGSEVGTLKHSCMYLCVAITSTQRKFYSATKNAESSAHRLPALCLRSWLPGPTPWALNVWPSASESHSQLTTLESHS